jgi:ubiquinone/menaquinone biosynthesis C-methylase UbiE
MDERDKLEIIRSYNERLLKFGDSSEALAVGTEERRRIRFQVLTEIGDLRGKKILDLGCGFGDLLDFLKEKGIEVDYTGYDINPKMIEIARKKHPGAQFKVIDITEEEFPIFDYILSTSAFNNKLKYEDNYKFIEKIFRITYEHAKEGVAIDFLSSYVDFKRDYAFYYEPENVFAIAKKITRRVCLRHDYPLFEFCIYLYKDCKFPY